MREAPVGAADQRHQLRLEVGREAGERLGGDLDRVEAAAVPPDAEAVVGGGDLGADLGQHLDRPRKDRRGRALEHDIAAGHRHRHRIGAGLDAVGHHRVARAGEAVDALDADGGGAGAVDLRAHLDQAGGEVDDLGLARGVLDDGFASGQRRRHHRDVGRADGDLREDDAPAAEALRRAGDDVAAVDVDLGAEVAQRRDEEIDRPRADGAAAGQRHPRLAHAGEQRADHPEARPHLRDELIGRDGVDDLAGGQFAASRR